MMWAWVIVLKLGLVCIILAYSHVSVYENDARDSYLGLRIMAEELSASDDMGIGNLLFIFVIFLRIYANDKRDSYLGLGIMAVEMSASDDLGHR